MAPNMAQNVGQVVPPGMPPGIPPHLIIPYTLVNNDARYLMPHGFATGADFFQQLRDAFDQLWLEGASSPKYMYFRAGLHASTRQLCCEVFSSQPPP